MKGHLKVSCALGADGRSYLREQSFRAPMHLSKPHHDAGALVMNLVNPTAGIFDDDEIEMDFRVEEGARLVLTTPSSSRVFRSRNGGHAAVSQTLTVARGGFLEFFPEPFIPHAGARYAQQNMLQVEEGASMIYFEWLAPGRVAAGEAFQYHELHWDTDVSHDGRLIARERYTLKPDDDSLSGLRAAGGAAHYVGCFVIGAIDFPAEQIAWLNDDGVYLGFGPLAGTGWAIRAICHDSLRARSTLSALRTALYAARGASAPSLGR